MSKRLAELVGKVVLAWGGMEQQLHSLVRMLAQASGEPFTNQPSFTNRVKLFRSLCNDLTNGDGAFLAEFDQFRTHLKRLEGDRGVIAHGWVAPRRGGALFASMPAMFKSSATQRLSTPYFTYLQLERLEADIHAAKETMARLCSTVLEWHDEP